MPVPAARRNGCLVAEWKREWWRVCRWEVNGVDIVLFVCAKAKWWLRLILVVMLCLLRLAIMFVEGLFVVVTSVLFSPT